ncbi:MarR family winged helix-turn-helix transcriptional regulator [Streptomyces arenae]|uniref:MarR family winged helix-turn-helix transcriptional regulator n=1 Tax=Streptomyces arenae TaxID=29301 RepID=UPI00265A7F24|nr:MarR family winged helix-turn-helix transcriptional regulator [Streptomyces arenae]MCG7202696.1 MarR family winged helix-turn-helix transcriptional regulator [Streptomyces arenae]
MSTAGSGAIDPDELQDDTLPEPVDLWSAFKRAHEIVRARVIADTAEAAGLSEPDLTILVNLDKAGGALRQSELAASLGWDRTRISHQVTRMGKRGLVTRERADGVTVTLTDAGRQAVTAVGPGLDAAVRRHFTDKLSAPEIETLSSVLRRL